jgi:hypothetical protein
LKQRTCKTVGVDPKPIVSLDNDQESPVTSVPHRVPTNGDNPPKVDDYTRPPENPSGNQSEVPPTGEAGFTDLSVNKPEHLLNQDTDGQSGILSLPSKCEDDFVAFSDIPIMKVDSLESGQPSSNVNRLVNSDHVNLIKGKTKPKGSAYVSCKMSIGDSDIIADVDICIDTGADFTLCDNAFLKNHFGGKDALIHIYHPYRVPNLRSASGHLLQILGKVEVTLLLGEFMMNIAVIVHEGDVGMFLLGSDSFYDKLIYDRGKFLAFADARYPPIPIQYELVRNLVQAAGEFRVAPHSSAVIPVKVTDNTQFTGKKVIISPLDDDDTQESNGCCESHKQSNLLQSPVRNSVSTINSQGEAYVLVENITDDILTILPDIELAKIGLISDDDDSEDEGRVSFVIDHTMTSSECQHQTPAKRLSENPKGKKDQWPISALKGELHNRLPSNIIVQWDKIPGGYSSSNSQGTDVDKLPDDCSFNSTQVESKVINKLSDDCSFNSTLIESDNKLPDDCLSNSTQVESNTINKLSADCSFNSTLIES